MIRKAKTRSPLKHHSQAYRIFKRLFQYIHANHLKPGDRLPPHQELSAMLGVSNDTLTAAMHAMVDAGVLVRRTRVGTVIANPDKVPPLVWSIGIAAFPCPAHGPSSFFAELCVRLQAEVARRGWRCMTYHRFTNNLPSAIADYGPLSTDLEESSLDGLILLTPISNTEWQRVRKQDVVLLHAAIDETTPGGVVIDEYAMTRQAIGMLLDRGCGTIATLAVKRPPNAQWRFQRAVDEIRDARKLGPHFIDQFPCHPSIDGGRTAAKELLALPKSERPSGLIVYDDYIAMGLTDRLAQDSDYRPTIIVKTLKQNPLTYSLPVLRFEVDINMLVKHTIDQLAERLGNPSLPETVQWIDPTPAGGEPQKTPSGTTSSLTL